MKLCATSCLPISSSGRESVRPFSAAGGRAPAALDSALQAILAKRSDVPARRSVLVGVTGIDGSGKGYVADKLVAALRKRGVHGVAINVDGWLNLPDRRFSRERPAEHFYEHAIRFDELFAELILPLKEHRSRRVVADFAEETATSYRQHIYEYQNVDVIILEGIFLLKQAYRDYFDLCFWVDCTFETALERAIQRSQEGLSPDETTRAYETIYFPAQEVHICRDNPRTAASAIIVNDPRLEQA